MLTVALTLARRAMILPLRQLNRIGPNRRWFSSQALRRGELLVAAQADPQADVGQQAVEDLRDFRGGLGFVGHGVCKVGSNKKVSIEMRFECGRGLAPDGGGSVMDSLLIHRYRGQAPSHS
jgi:hypothetical protein